MMSELVCDFNRNAFFFDFTIWSILLFSYTVMGLVFTLAVGIISIKKNHLLLLRFSDVFHTDQK